MGVSTWCGGERGQEECTQAGKDWLASRGGWSPLSGSGSLSLSRLPVVVRAVGCRCSNCSYPLSTQICLLALVRYIFFTFSEGLGLGVF